MPVTVAKAAPSPEAMYETIEAALALASSTLVFSTTAGAAVGGGLLGEFTTGLGGVVYTLLMFPAESGSWGSAGLTLH